MRGAWGVSGAGVARGAWGQQKRCWSHGGRCGAHARTTPQLASPGAGGLVPRCEGRKAKRSSHGAQRAGEAGFAGLTSPASRRARAASCAEIRSAAWIRACLRRATKQMPTLVSSSSDAVARGLTFEISERFEKRGLPLVACKMLQPTREQAARRTASSWKNLRLLAALVDFLVSGPAVVLVWDAEPAAVQALAGDADPAKAALGSIRGDLAVDRARNLPRVLRDGGGREARDGGVGRRGDRGGAGAGGGGEVGGARRQRRSGGRRGRRRRRRRRRRRQREEGAGEGGEEGGEGGEEGGAQGGRGHKIG